MSKPGLRAAILVVSTTASKDPSTDTSGGILRDVFEKEGAGQWTVEETRVVGDVVLDIQRTVAQWTDQETPVHLIVTTGGTGFAIFDNTPEACSIMMLSWVGLTRDSRLYHLYFIDMHPDWFMACLLPL
jgi:gephyrin